MKNKNTLIIVLAIMSLAFLAFAGSASALTVVAEFENGQHTATINNSESAGYDVAVINDQSFSYTELTIRIFDYTTGTYELLGTLESANTTQVFFFPSRYYINPEDYANLPGSYYIDVKAKEHIYGTTVIQSDELYLEVSGNRPPRVDFNYTPLSPTTDDIVVFSAQAEDDDGTVVLYRWDFDNDGNFDKTGQSAEHRFETAGTYLVKVVATDNEGATGEKTKEIIVSQGTPSNQPPYFVSSPVTRVTLGQEYSYDANAVDPDNDRLTYFLYSAPDNMAIDSNSGLIFWTPQSVGNFPVDVRVQDGFNNPVTQSYSIEVLEPENIPPKADFYYEPSNPVELNPVSFYSNSTDSDGTIVSYLWKVSGTNVGTQNKLIYTFNSANTYEVSLTVKDDDGAESTILKSVVVTSLPSLVIDELSCNENVVQGHEQHCSVHIKNNVEGVTVNFKYSGSNELLGTCTTNMWGYCHINPIINKPAGMYEIYATAYKNGYYPDNSMLLRTRFKVWTERYIIENLKTWEDQFIIENYTFYRSNPVYSSFDVKDQFTGQYLEPNSGIIRHVFLRVNNANPLNFTVFGTFKLSAVTSFNSNIQNSPASATSIGAFKYMLDMIPLSDDYLGEGKVFAFVFNFSDDTAGQDSVNVDILNNELEFNPPERFQIESGESIEIDFSSYLYDIETPDNEILMTSGEAFPLSVVQYATNKFRVTAPLRFNGEENIFFTADDRDGSVITKGIIFEVIGGELFPPIADFKHEPVNPVVNELVTFTSTSTDQDGNITTYEWTVDGETLLLNSKVITYTFGSTGDHIVKLKVVDNDNLYSEKTKKIVVSAGNDTNIAPHASFTYAPIPVYVKEKVYFNSTSYDSDGIIVKYEWFIGDELVSNNLSFEYIFMTEGRYDVTLKVTDDDAAFSIVSREVEVLKGADLGAPVAILNAPSSTILGKKVVLDASASYDPDGFPLVNYAWKIIKDGAVIDTFTTTTPIIEYAFGQRYTNYIELTVTDIEGKTDTTSLRIDVGKQRSDVVVGHGKDDGLYIDYYDVYGIVDGTISPEEAYTVTITVSNDRGDTLRNLQPSFSIPELGYKVSGNMFNLNGGKTKQVVIQDYLPFLDGEIPPGEYISVVSIAGDNIIKTKYYPLIIE